MEVAYRTAAAVTSADHLTHLHSGWTASALLLFQCKTRVQEGRVCGAVTVVGVYERLIWVHRFSSEAAAHDLSW